MTDRRFLQETRRHGAAQFPFNIYPCTIPQDFPQVALHWQNSMELVFVKKGGGIVQAGLTPWAARAGDIFIFAPGMLHALRQGSGAMEYENIIFELELLGGTGDLCAERYLLPLQSGRLPLPVRLAPGDSVYPAAAACLREAEDASRTQGAGYELAIKGALLRFLALLVGQRGAPPPAESADTQRLKAVLQLVADRYAEPLPVAAAAAACQCSPSHFMRWFKKMTGQSFTAYLIDHRLSIAAETLRQTDATVLAVAGQCGFDNLSYFNRAFKRRYGMTPRAYRSRDARA